MSFIDDLYNLVSYISSVAQSFISILSSIGGAFTTAYNIFLDVLSVLPLSWTVPIGVGLTVVIAYEVYNWIKDISIGGNKI